MFKYCFIFVILAGSVFLSCSDEFEGPGVGPECTLVWVSYRDGSPNLWGVELPDGEVFKLSELPEGAGRWGISARRGWVYFSGKEYNCWNVYRVSLDGSSMQKLTEHTQFDGYPEISPDGSSVCFVTKRWGFTQYDSELALISSNGGELVRMTNHEGNDDSHRWSPDGTKIVFVKTDYYGKLSVALFNPDFPESVSIISPEGFDAYSPQWSADGASLYYIISGSDRRYIAKSNVDSPILFPENMSGNEYSVENPEVSPNGVYIACQAFVNGQWEIAVIGSDGDNFKLIAPHPSEDICPCWSPDGSWIFWVSYRDGDREIYGISFDEGGGPERITSSPGDDIRPLCVGAF